MRFFCIAILLSLFGCGASHTDNVASHQNWPTRETLMQSLWDADTVMIVYSAADGDVAKAIGNAIQKLNDMTDKLVVQAERDDKITEYSVQHYPLYVVGTYNNTLMRRFDGIVPADLSPEGFIFDDTHYNAVSDILKIATYPNAFNPQLPVTIVYGNNADYLAQFLQPKLDDENGFFFWDQWGYQVFHDNHRMAMGNFSEEASDRWSLDKKLHYTFDYTGKKVHENAYFALYDHNAETEQLICNDYVIQTGKNIGELETFSGKKSGKPYSIHIYPSAEVKTLMFNDPTETIVDDANLQVHTVIKDEYLNISNGYELIPAVRNVMGDAQLTILEKGMAVRFTPDWLSYGYLTWAYRLQDADVFPPLHELLDNTLYANNSPLIADCAAAVYIDYLIDRFGRETFLKKYNNWKQNDPELTEDEAGWKKYCEVHLAGTVITRPKEKQFPYLRGFNFAHEGYAVYNGYMGSLAQVSLDSIHALGSNTVSIIPYAGFRSMNDPHPFRLSNNGGSENDAAVVRAAYNAHMLGMDVMLKPQIWSWMGWTGDIEMQDQQEWNAFFAYYDEWIMHYAMLAEVYHMPFLCAGVEFGKATLAQPQQWEVLFEKIRKVYSGKLVYAANWGEEVENITFWDKLDYIGVNCYYPLTDKKDPSDTELMAGFTQNMRKLESLSKQYHKKVLFTEIGFTSTKYPWLAPHKESETDEYDANAQDRCYQIMAKCLSDQDWIAGVYLWKWPSYMSHTDRNSMGFTPCGKPAENTVREWFGSMP
ncbi:MAG: hypothetical protein R2794_04540 [Chitinophagales bacterium]